MPAACVVRPVSAVWAIGRLVAFRAWPNDVAHDVFVPYRNAKMRAHPWGGGCEPVWLKGRVRNCKVLTAIGDQISTGEPPKDHPDVQRGVIVVYGQSRTRTTSYVMNLSAAYTWTGEISAEAARLILEGWLRKPGFQSMATAFDHRQLIRTFHALGYCSPLPN